MSRPLKILYLMVENTAGTLNLFTEYHIKLGNEARFVTLFRTAEGFDEDICLDMPLMPNSKWFRKGKETVYTRERLYKNAPCFPPTWTPSVIEKLFFVMRDTLWKRRLKRAFREHNLLDYDIYHLEGGHGFLRTKAWPFDELKKRGRHILVNYHGADMRTRGVLPWIDAISDINTTSELDLIHQHPKIDYVFLPYDTKKHKPRYSNNQPLRLCHATRDRRWKGSDIIINTCKRLEKSHGIEFVLIENQTHEKTLQMKASCDIYIDQISNLGGWGYGMNSVEALSMGLACCTNLVPEYETFLGKHPFYNVHKDSLFDDLARLIQNKDKITLLKKEGRAWVEKTHDIGAVMKTIYQLYHQNGWIKELPDAFS